MVSVCVCDGDGSGNSSPSDGQWFKVELSTWVGRVMFVAIAGIPQLPCEQSSNVQHTKRGLDLSQT